MRSSSFDLDFRAGINEFGQGAPERGKADPSTLPDEDVCSKSWYSARSFPVHVFNAEAIRSSLVTVSS